MREPISFTCKCDRSCKVEKFRTQNLYWGFKSQPNAYHISSRSWISGKKIYHYFRLRSTIIISTYGERISIFQGVSHSKPREIPLRIDLLEKQLQNK